jgi:dTDP-4-amino-4,6-dideoxygalactose transaminase
MILCANPSAQFDSYQTEIEAAVLAVMRSQRYILGNEVKALEEEFAEYIGVSHAIGVANGTDALELALRALEIKNGDEVITVSHTAVASVAAIEATGASPVLVDVEKNFYTLDSSQLEEAFSLRTKCVIVVHLYGQPANIEVIKVFCDKNNLFLIEDTSQAHGATYKNMRLGSFGDIGCFSCYPTKNLGAIGDAGLITTNNSALSSKIKMLREYGWRNRVSEFPGRNSRLDEIQAAVLRIKLKNLDSDNSKRVALSEYYREQLNDLPIFLPPIRVDASPVYHLFVVQVDYRDDLISYFKDSNIQAGIHYITPVHFHPAYINRIKTTKNMSVTENLVKKIISLPLYPELSFSDVQIVVDVLKEFSDNNY